MATDQDNFAARLIRARSGRGWSQQDLSKASTVAAAQISRYEQGSNAPRPHVIAKLAAALGVSFDWLMSGVETVDDDELAAGMRSIRLFLPADLLTKLETAAMVERRTLGQEVRARLHATFDETVVTTIEARVKPGAEEKRFEFNADEIADKVVERLEGRNRRPDPNKVIIVGNYGKSPDSRSAFNNLYASMMRDSGSVNAIIQGRQELGWKPRGNEPYGPKTSPNAPKPLPKKPKPTK